MVPNVTITCEDCSYIYHCHFYTNEVRMTNEGLFQSSDEKLLFFNSIIIAGFLFYYFSSAETPKSARGRVCFRRYQELQMVILQLWNVFLFNPRVYQFIKYKNPKLENNMILQKTEGGCTLKLIGEMGKHR